MQLSSSGFRPDISKRIASTGDENELKRMVSNCENGWGSGPTMFSNGLAPPTTQGAGGCGKETTAVGERVGGDADEGYAAGEARKQRDGHHDGVGARVLP